MSVFHNNALIGSGGGAAAATPPGVRSLRFNDGETTSLTRTPSSAGNRKTWTWSGWVKRSELGGSGAVLFSGYSGSVNADLYITFVTSATSSGSEDAVALFSPPAGSDISISSNAIFRDTSAWYHIVVACDTTQSTAADRVKIYINGAEVTYNTTSYPAQNATLAINDTKQHAVGSRPVDGGGNSNGFSGYMTDIFFIDGLQLAPTSFGSYDSNGVWQRGTYSGTFGTNGFHVLDFENEATIGHDSSGNSNDFNATNLSDTAGAGNDVLLDFPVNGSESDTGAGGEVSGNYAVFNRLLDQDGQSVTLSNGNLDFTSAASSGQYGTRVSTIGVTSGKFYAEFTVGAVGNGIFIGITRDPGGDTNHIGAHATSFGYLHNGQKFNNNSGSSYGASYTAGDVIGIALDLDNGQVTFFKNGSTQGVAFSSLAAGTYFMGVSGASSAAAVANWGQRAFAHSAPSNFKALCTKNLPTPAIADGSDHFNTVLYVGNETARSISCGFSPDLVWLKNRDTSGYHHYWVDTVRGSDKNLFTNLTEGEQDAARLSSFDSNGFSLTNHAGVNKNGDDYCAWCWDAGTTTSSNSSGNITTSLRVNTTCGFSIAKYSFNNSSGNQTLAHGLGSIPDLVIRKDTNVGDPWSIYSKAVGFTSRSNFSNAAFSGTTTFGSASATSSFNRANNMNNGTYVDYSFVAIPGFSAFGVYEGNGSSSSGPFIFTDFSIAWVMIKRTDATNNWVIYDTARDTFNIGGRRLYADLSDNENQNTSHYVDILSNGFKVYSGGGNLLNASSGTYLYAAFASNPFSANGGLAR